MIPKIIHYCWFGGGKLPEDYASYIKEWAKINKGYKVVRWDESNSPMELDYIKKAVDNKKWANVSNYVRLHALYNQGGIYLDTDMKMIKPLDDFLQDECFLGFEEGEANKEHFIVNNAILGSVKNNIFIKNCMEVLLRNFDGVEEADLSAPQLVTSVLKEKYGLKKYGKQLLKKKIKLYPKEYFYPIHVHKAYFIQEYEKHIFPETICVHMWGRSWLTSDVMIDTIDYLNHTLIVRDEKINELKLTNIEQRKVSDEIWEAKLFLENELIFNKKQLELSNNGQEGKSTESLVNIFKELIETKRFVIDNENKNKEEKLEFENKFLAIKHQLDALDFLKEKTKDLAKGIGLIQKNEERSFKAYLLKLELLKQDLLDQQVLVKEFETKKAVYKNQLKKEAVAIVGYKLELENREERISNLKGITEKDKKIINNQEELLLSYRKRIENLELEKMNLNKSVNEFLQQITIKNSENESIKRMLEELKSEVESKNSKIILLEDSLRIKEKMMSENKNAIEFFEEKIKKHNSEMEQIPKWIKKLTIKKPLGK